MHRGSNNNNNPQIIDRAFLNALLEFIGSVESELDMLLPHSSSLQFLSSYKVIDYLITQRRQKNIIIRLLCDIDDNTTEIVKKLVPFMGYKSIKPASSNAAAISLVFIRDKQDIFSASIHMQQNDKKNNTDTVNGKWDGNIFSIYDWVYSINISLVNNAISSFEAVWEEKDNYDRISKEKKHSELLVDLITHDIGNYHQIVQSSLDLVTSLLKKNKTDVSEQDNEKISSLLNTAITSLTRSQSFVDNIRRLEQLYRQNNLKLVLKNIPDAVNNAYSTVEQTLYNNNPHSKKISLNMMHDRYPLGINIMAEDLLDEIFINLFSNTVKYTDLPEVKIDVAIIEYFIGETKYWMITVSDNGQGIPDSIKKELFERFYSKG